MCGQRRSTAPSEAGQNTRRVRCAPRGELPPELKHQVNPIEFPVISRRVLQPSLSRFSPQYTLDQVKGIVQDIKHRLGHLQVPNIEKQRKNKGRRRPPSKQLKQRTP